jgi:hypothetical protein
VVRVHESQRVDEPPALAGVEERQRAGEAASLSRGALALNRRATSGARNGSPLASCRIRSAYGRRIRASWRQIQTSPSCGSRNTSKRQQPATRSRAHAWWPAASVSVDTGTSSPAMGTWKSTSGNRSAISANRAWGTAISTSLWSRVCRPRNRSSAQPAAMHQGTDTPASRSPSTVGCHGSHASRSGTTAATLLRRTNPPVSAARNSLDQRYPYTPRSASPYWPQHRR